MLRTEWRIYVCSECSEIYLYPGVCENRDRHQKFSENNILKPITVRYVHPPPQNSLSMLQQPEGVRSEGEEEPE